LYRRGLTLDEAIEAIAELGDDAVITTLLDSLKTSTRGIIR
jgi:acyl-[acyl carrier protein]--UDP-N-acetylglucosamine O-acyltransferase